MSVHDVIDCAQCVYNSIGAGHSENAYHKAMEVEMSARGVLFNSEAHLVVKHRGQPVAHRRPDILVETDDGTIILELKAQTEIQERHIEQLESYVVMASQDYNVDEVCGAVLVNFTSDGVASQVVYSDEMKETKYAGVEL